MFCRLPVIPGNAPRKFRFTSSEWVSFMLVPEELTYLNSQVKRELFVKSSPLVKAGDTHRSGLITTWC